jgi:hypothetical protein
MTTENDTPAQPAETEVTPLVLHREYLLAHWRDLDPCLWRFFRASGFRAILETDDALRHGATDQLVFRGETRGEVSYAIAVLLDPEQAEGQAQKLLGAIYLFPQLNGSTQVQVTRFVDSTPEIDAALVNLWREARAWLYAQANGQVAAQRARAAMPRRPGTA